MDIKRFDEIEFDILNCATSGMYSLKDEISRRALILMREKLIKYNPRKNWPKSGWRLTDAGKKYHEAFMDKVQKTHGHVWESHEDGRVDIFAYSMGYHNGPRCKNCGYEFCQHCDSEFNAPKCSRK